MEKKSGIRNGLISLPTWIRKQLGVPKNTSVECMIKEDNIQFFVRDIAPKNRQHHSNLAEEKLKIEGIDIDPAGVLKA